MDSDTDEHRVALNTGRQWVRLLAGMAVLLALTAYFVHAAVTSDETKKVVGGVILGVLCGALTVAIGIGGAFAVKPRALVATADGLRLDGSRLPWQVRWADVRSVAVQSGYTVAGRASLFPGRWRRVPTVRLVIELNSLDGPGPLPRRAYRGRWGASKTGFGIPLGPVRELVAPLDAALRATAGGRYAGVTDLGEVRGLL